MSSEVSPSKQNILNQLMKASSQRAANALSKMTGRAVTMKPAEAKYLRLGDIPAELDIAEEKIISIQQTVSGDVSGNIIMVFPRKVGLLLADILQNREIGTTRLLQEIDFSALSEVSNIIVAAYLNSLSRLLKIDIDQSVPKLTVTVIGDAIRSATRDMEKEEVPFSRPRKSLVLTFLAEYTIKEKMLNIGGYLVSLLDEDSTRMIVDSISEYKDTE